MLVLLQPTNNFGEKWEKTAQCKHLSPKSLQNLQITSHKKMQSTFTRTLYKRHQEMFSQNKISHKSDTSKLFTSRDNTLFFKWLTFTDISLQMFKFSLIPYSCNNHLSVWEESVILVKHEKCFHSNYIKILAK